LDKNLIKQEYFKEVSSYLKCDKITSLKQLYKLTQVPQKEYIRRALILQRKIIYGIQVNSNAEDSEIMMQVHQSNGSYKIFSKVFNKIITSFDKPIDMNFINTFPGSIFLWWDVFVGDGHEDEVKLEAVLFVSLFFQIFNQYEDEGTLRQCIGNKCLNIFRPKKPNQLWCSNKCRKHDKFQKYYYGCISVADFIVFGKKKAKEIYLALWGAGYFSNNIITKKFNAKRKEFNLKGPFTDKEIDKIFKILLKKQKRKPIIQKRAKKTIRDARAKSLYYWKKHI